MPCSHSRLYRQLPRSCSRNHHHPRFWLLALQLAATSAQRLAALLTGAHWPLQVPYGGAFYQKLQFACQYEGRQRCHLRITGQCEFRKSVMVKGLIAKASVEVSAWLCADAGNASCLTVCCWL